MSRWNTRGLRGSTFEELVNLTNENYREKRLALIQKIPTSIRPIEVDNVNKSISLAYFEKKSTVDYIGAVQGLPVCFDAKETAAKNLPLQNIHAHQIDFMRDFEAQGGLAFLLVHFTIFGEYFLLPFVELSRFWADSVHGGQKSIPYESFDKKMQVTNKNGFYLHYLEPLNVYLCTKSE